MLILKVQDICEVHGHPYAENGARVRVTSIIDGMRCWVKVIDRDRISYPANEFTIATNHLRLAESKRIRRSKVTQII